MGSDLLHVVPLRDRAAATLRAQIFDGRLTAGMEITQEQIAERLGISRMPVREAFQILERDGLLIRKTYRRSVIPVLSEADITDHYQIRALIESEAIARAATRAKSDPQIVSRLQEAIEASDRGANLRDTERYGEAAEHFHRAIWVSSGSGRLQMVASGLWAGFPPHEPASASALLKRSSQEHREMLAAICAGDESMARQQMSAHILRNLNVFLKTYRRQRGAD